MSKKSNTTTKHLDEKIEEIKVALKENYIQQKKLMNELQELMQKKKLKNSRSCKINSSKNSGFNKPEPIPKPLAKLLHIKEDTLPRSKVTVLIYEYFTNHKMYDKNKKEIIPNTKIRKIFAMDEDDTIDFYNLQTWLDKVYEENKA